MIVLTKVTQVDEDQVLIEGFDDSNPAELLKATGWVSATTNHFDKKAYDDEGNRDSNAKPRSMTDNEKTAYWTELLEEVLRINNPEKVEGKTLFNNKEGEKVHADAVEQQEADSATKG